jgi:hypothetical protein
MCVIVVIVEKMKVESGEGEETFFTKQANIHARGL